jgi:hypothetical protein
VEALIASLARVMGVQDLTNRDLWGKDTSDDRFMLVAQP